MSSVRIYATRRKKNMNDSTHPDLDVSLSDSMSDTGHSDQSTLDNTTRMAGNTKKKKAPRCSIKKKIGTSSSLPKVTANLSYSSIMKQTLRSNNRALARALERKKAEVYGAQKEILHLAQEKQAVLERLARLEKLVGAKDAELDSEVHSRMQDRLGGVSSILNQACSSLVLAVELIHDAIGLCGKRNPSTTSRPSSWVRSSTECSPRPTRSVIFSDTLAEVSPGHAKAEAEAEAEAGPDNSRSAWSVGLGESTSMGQDLDGAARSLTKPLTDLSMILEQSYFMDNVPLPFTEEEPERERPASRSSRNRKKSTSQECGQSCSRKSSLKRSVVFSSDAGVTLLGAERRTRSHSKSCHEQPPSNLAGNTDDITADVDDATVTENADGVSKPVHVEDSQDFMAWGDSRRSGRRTTIKRHTLSVSVASLSDNDSESQVTNPSRLTRSRTRASRAGTTVNDAEKWSVAKQISDETGGDSSAGDLGTLASYATETHVLSGEVAKPGKSKITADSLLPLPKDETLPSKKQSTENTCLRSPQNRSCPPKKARITEGTSLPPPKDSLLSKHAQAKSMEITEDPLPPAGVSQAPQQELDKQSPCESHGNSTSNTPIDERAFLPAFIPLDGADAAPKVKVKVKAKASARKLLSKHPLELDGNVSKTSDKSKGNPEATEAVQLGTIRHTFEVPLPPGEVEVPGEESRKLLTAVDAPGKRICGRHLKVTKPRPAKTTLKHKGGTFVAPPGDSDQENERKCTSSMMEDEATQDEALLFKDRKWHNPSTAATEEGITDETDDVLINSSFDDAVFDDPNLPKPLMSKQVFPFENTICFDEDMELTEVIDTSKLQMALAAAGKAPVPAFVAVEHSEEPDFLHQDGNKAITNKPRDNTIGQEESSTDAESKNNAEKEEGAEDKGTAPSSGHEDRNDRHENTPNQDCAMVKNEEIKKDDSLVVDRDKQNTVTSGASATSIDTVSGSASTGETTESTPDVKAPAVAKKRQSRSRFTAMLDKPGKIKYTAGPRTSPKVKDAQMSATARSKSKTSHSILPKISKRSKARLKAKLPEQLPQANADELSSTFDFAGTPQGPKTASGKEKSTFDKSVYDLSLSESLCSVPAAIKKSKGKANKSIMKKESATSDNQDEVVYTKKTSMVDSPHGIMLVLGNGRRTKPRAGGKKVQISCSSEVTVRSPSPTPSGDKGQVSQDAGKTPPQPVLACSALPANAGFAKSQDAVAAPENPSQAEDSASSFKETTAKRTLSTAGVFQSDSSEEPQPEENRAPVGKKAKLSLTRKSKEQPLSKIQALRLKRKALEAEKIEQQAAASQAASEAQLKGDKNTSASVASTSSSATSADKCWRCGSKLTGQICKLCPRDHLGSAVVKDKALEKVGSPVTPAGNSSKSCLPAAGIPRPSTRLSLSSDSEEFTSLQNRHKKPKRPEYDGSSERGSIQDADLHPRWCSRKSVNDCEGRNSSDLKVVDPKFKSQGQSLRHCLVPKQKPAEPVCEDAPPTDTRRKTKGVAVDSQAETREEAARTVSDKSKERNRHEKSLDKENVMWSTTKDEVTRHSSVRLSEGGEEGGRRRRRAATFVSYKEPSLGAKLRQGDPGTVSVYKNGIEELAACKKSGKKRSVLSVASNLMNHVPPL